MPLKKDDSGRRWVEMEFLVPGTPEQVWQAIATGPGMSAWFTPTSVDEHVGGAITFDFGDGSNSPAVVTEWQPPDRFAYEERDWSGDAPPIATEITVTGRSGDRCVVRMVHSLFTERDDWDDELESFESGWPGFFEVLKVYLGGFAGMPGASISASANGPGDDLDVWTRLTAALGLAGASVGEHRESPGGAPRLAGVIHRVEQAAGSRYVMIRLTEPCDGVAMTGTYALPGQVRASVLIFLYGAEATDIAATERANWTTWLRGVLEGQPAAT